MNAYGMIANNKYFKKYPNDITLFVAWCKKHKYSLFKEPDWMFPILKSAYFISLLYINFDATKYIVNEINHFERSHNEKVSENRQEQVFNG